MKRDRDTDLSLGDVADRAILDAISTSRMKPGDRLSEYQVAQWLNISRTPAREGLRRLESEGLLTAHPRRGLMVAGLDDAAVHELYAAREILEGTAAGSAARFATDAEIGTLRHLVETEARLAETPERMYEHNRLFHQVIYDAARNRYVKRFLQSIADTLSTHRSVSTLVSQARREAVLREHRAIVDAIERHDEAAAREAACAHIRGALHARLEVQRAIASGPPGEPAPSGAAGVPDAPGAAPRPDPADASARVRPASAPRARGRAARA